MTRQAHTTFSGGLGYLIDDRYLLHNPGARHPESPQRLLAIKEAIKIRRDAQRWRRIYPRKATHEELQLVHSPFLIERVEKASRRAPSYLDYDTAVSSESFETALLAAGGVLECIDGICSGDLRRVVAFVRPPGHHADHRSARGFCLFNNVALAAAYAIRKHGLKRVAVVDIDVHHGNGTQSCFYNTPDVLYVSSHQSPLYPGTGDFSETGMDGGKGFTLNFPLPEATGDSTFVPLYTKIIAAVLDQYAPQIILVSAGFDGHVRDPLGGLDLTERAYRSAAASLMRAANRSCEGRICFVLEGGYSMQALKECTEAIMEQMELEYPEELQLREDSVFREISRRATTGFWKW